jgi:hypothetical protein
MLKSSSLCWYSSNLGTFWLKIEQFWPFEEISIFSKLKTNLLLWNYWANYNQTLLKWSLGGPLSKLCPSAPSCIQHAFNYIFPIMNVFNGDLFLRAFSCIDCFLRQMNSISAIWIVVCHQMNSKNNQHR